TRFKHGPRDGRPTAIICHSAKGFGAFASFFNKHKVSVPEDLLDQELEQQNRQRDARIAEFTTYCGRLDPSNRDELLAAAERMRIKLDLAAGTATAVIGPVATQRAPVRDKAIRYDATAL